MVTINQGKCIGCGRCAADCVAGNIKLSGGKAASAGECILCGHCVAICPSDAVAIPAYDMADVELYDENRTFAIDNFLYAVKFRRSIRDYQPKKVEREKLEAIIQAGRYTATGANRQACRFVVVQDQLPVFKDLLWHGVDEAQAIDAPSPEMFSALKHYAALRAEGTDYLFRNAPAVIFIGADSAVDAGLAAQNMEMAAVAQGLGMLYDGFMVYAASTTPAALEWLDLKDKPLAVCMLLGYPEPLYQRSAPRRDADVRWL